MLFASTYKYRVAGSEESQKRVVNLFVNWKPPQGFQFKAHYAFSDGSGGLALIEAESATAAYEGVVPWVPYLEFHTVPIIEIDKAVPLALKAMAWRDSVK